MKTQGNPILRIQDSLVVIVDFQERIARAMFERDRCEDAIIRLIKIMNILGVPFIVTEQYSKGLGPTTPKIKELLEANDQYHPIEKNTFSCFRETLFLDELENFPNKKQLLIAGIECHVCVMQTVLDSLKSIYDDTYIITDAVTSRMPSSMELGFRRMEMSGVYPVNVEMAAFEWLEKAGTAEFKAVQKLIIS